MKKIIFILFCLAFLNFKGFALDYSSYCSSETPSKNFKGNMASLTGTNFLARKIAAYEISKELKKTTNSKMKVKISNFYGISLTDGIFKDLSLNGENFQYDGMIISKMNAKTLCPYNHIQYKDDRISYIENMVLNYSVDMTQEDLNKSLKSNKFQQMINKVNSDKVLSNLLKIENPALELQKDKLILKYKVTPIPSTNSPFSFAKNFVKPFNIKVGAGLKISDNRIELCDFDLNSIKMDYSYFLPFINMLNPADSKIKLDKYNEGELKIDDVKIDTSKISINGTIIVMGKNNK